MSIATGMQFSPQIFDTVGRKRMSPGRLCSPIPDNDVQSAYGTSWLTCQAERCIHVPCLYGIRQGKSGHYELAHVTHVLDIMVAIAHLQIIS